MVWAWRGRAACAAGFHMGCLSYVPLVTGAWHGWPAHVAHAWMAYMVAGLPGLVSAVCLVPAWLKTPADSASPPACTLLPLPLACRSAPAAAATCPPASSSAAWWHASDGLPSPPRVRVCADAQEALHGPPLLLLWQPAACRHQAPPVQLWWQLALYPATLPCFHCNHLPFCLPVHGAGTVYAQNADDVTGTTPDSITLEDKKGYRTCEGGSTVGVAPLSAGLLMLAPAPGCLCVCVQAGRHAGGACCFHMVATPATSDQQAAAPAF